MKLNLKNTPAKLDQIGNKIRPYLTFGFTLIGLLVYGLVVLQISKLNNAQPTVEQLDEKLQSIKRSRIDQKSIDQIQQLQDQNVQVQSLFEDARNNPFQE